jgi:hypothetical protein
VLHVGVSFSIRNRFQVELDGAIGRGARVQRLLGIGVGGRLDRRHGRAGPGHPGGFDRAGRTVTLLRRFRFVCLCSCRTLARCARGREGLAPVVIGSYVSGVKLEAECFRLR